jgi:DNA mismatch repair ATPase MutS
MKSKKGGRGGKYASELERLKRLNAINEVLKKSDIENAALTNTSKDSETVSDSVIDNMLNQLNIDRHATRDLDIVENLATKGRNGSIIKKNRRIKIRHTKTGMHVRKKVHFVKRPKSNKSKRKKR